LEIRSGDGGGGVASVDIVLPTPIAFKCYSAVATSTGLMVAGTVSMSMVLIQTFSDLDTEKRRFARTETSSSEEKSKGKENTGRLSNLIKPLTTVFI